MRQAMRLKKNYLNDKKKPQAVINQLSYCERKKNSLTAFSAPFNGDFKLEFQCIGKTNIDIFK